MPQNRQWRPVSAIAEDYAAGHEIPSHHHNRAQLIHAVHGVMRVATEHGIWVVPPGRGVWVPPRVVHSIRMRGHVGMRTIYVSAGATRDAPAHCSVVHVSPLLRELLVRATELRMPYPLGGPEERTVALLLDEIRTAPVTPLHLPTPRDARLRIVTDALLADPADTRPLAAWGRAAGATERTLARTFLRETGMTFGAWRQQVRLLCALELLAEGRAVTAVALELGYASTSAFIAMFRRALGTTPSRYFRAFPSTPLAAPEEKRGARDSQNQGAGRGRSGETQAP